MKYIYYQAGNDDFIILVQVDDGWYEYFTQCEMKSVAEKLVNVLNAAEAK